MNKEYTLIRRVYARIGFITLLLAPLAAWYIITLSHNVSACLALA